MPNSSGIIIILSYPDTIVRPAYWERFSSFWPKIGIGGKHAVQAGHAALLLIKKGKEDIQYFDFGRYITSYGNGRVRSKETDFELSIPIKAIFNNNNTLSNIEEILRWVDSHPEKTHGEGRLIASINYDIDFKEANIFIHNMINIKEIPYGAFIKNGSNCARFVTDTIIKSTTNKTTKAKLKSSNLFTPSPIGNVIKGTSNNIIYEVKNKEIKLYNNRSILKEYRDSFLNKFTNEPNLIGTEKPDLNLFNPKNATWLGGIGSGAWFKVESKKSDKEYIIARYTFDGQKDFEGKFQSKNTKFDFKKAHNFVYPSTCKEIFINQENKIYSLKKVLF